MASKYEDHMTHDQEPLRIFEMQECIVKLKPVHVTYVYSI